MRLSITFMLLLLTLSAWASDDTEVRDLFNRYERVVSGHEVHLIEEVFSKRFLKDNGGKADFIEKVKSEPRATEKSTALTEVSWKKGAESEVILVKLKPKSTNKMKSHQPHSEFILVKENGKLKIDGTVGDAD